LTIPLETLADGLLVAPQPRRLAPAALFGESIVEGREALGTRDGDQEVPPDEADQSLDLALVVALARPASYVRKLVTELSGGVFGYLDSVLERHSFDEFGELI
jgi:hypothetical protein